MRPLLQAVTCTYLLGLPQQALVVHHTHPLYKVRDACAMHLIAQTLHAESRNPAVSTGLRCYQGPVSEPQTVGLL